MPKLDLEPLNLESIEEKSKKLDLEPLDLEPIESTDSTESNPDFSNLESFGQGAVQGATVGFSDELGGALGAAMEKILPSGNKEGKSLKELYEEYRDFQRQRNKAAEEANTGSYLAGNIAGGVASGIALPGTSTLKGAAALGAATGLGSSEADLTEGEIGKAGIDTAIGAGLGVSGSLIGKGLQKLLSKKSLESAGSKLASDVVGIRPSKELAKVYNRETGKLEMGSNIIRGIGKTASEEGALPVFGTSGKIYDKTIDAIQKNEQKILPLLADAQEKIGPNIQNILDDVGHVGDKAGKFIKEFEETIPVTSKRDLLIKKLYRTYGPKLEQLSNADGNLIVLNELKREFQAGAKELSKNIYSSANSMEAQTEAQFLKQLGGIVRQHIEDIADKAGVEQIGQQIKHANKTLANLYTFENAAMKALDRSKGFGLKDLATEALYRTPEKIAAKTLLGGAKIVDTPIGKIISKTAPKVTEKTIISPFAIEKIQDLSGETRADKISSMLYNATDDSLREVASSLEQNPSIKQYGEALKRALDNDNMEAKNRAIFLILQNPISRKLLNPENE